MENHDLEVKEQEVKNINLSQIEQNENSRVVYKQQDLSDLMQSMKTNGLLQAVGVKKIGPNKYEAVWGNRRIVAARKLGWRDIPARVIEVETDVDRDIIGLIENIKRQNTTPSEDGRMFASLMDRGLSVDEIAARLSISKDRIELALDIYNHIPKEYQKIIKNRYGGVSKKQAGVISAGAAQHVLGLRRTHGLTKSQTVKLLDLAKKEDVTSSQIAQIAPLVGVGFSLSEAMKMASSLTRVNLMVFIDAKTIKTLENKYEKSITAILMDQLEKDKELGILRSVTQQGKMKMRTFARIGADR